MTKKTAPVVDPLAVLRSIAADTTAPATARVAAARALLHEAKPAKPKDAPSKVSDRALVLMAGGKK